jgi:hypothetical protein
MQHNKPQMWCLNASWGEHNLTELFTRKGYWELDPTRHSDRSCIGKISKMKKGDSVHLVRFSEGACRTIEATGVVMIVNVKRLQVSITWQQQNLRRREYYSGTARPIYGPLVVNTKPT